MYVDIYNSVIPPILDYLTTLYQTALILNIYTKPLKKIVKVLSYNMTDIKASHCVYIISEEKLLNNPKQKHFWDAKILVEQT